MDTSVASGDEVELDNQLTTEISEDFRMHLEDTDEYGGVLYVQPQPEDILQWFIESPSNVPYGTGGTTASKVKSFKSSRPFPKLLPPNSRKSSKNPSKAKRISNRPIPTPKITAREVRHLNTAHILNSKRKRIQYKDPFESKLAELEENIKPRLVNSISKLRGEIFQNGIQKYLCVMRKSWTSNWRNQGNIDPKELVRLIDCYGHPKPWFECPHQYKRPVKRTLKDNIQDDCPNCPSQDIYETTDEEEDDDQDEDGDTEDDDGGDAFNLVNFPNCSRKANDLPFRVGLMLHRAIIGSSGNEGSGLSAVDELNMELGSGNGDKRGIDMDEQNESGVSAPDGSLDHFDSTQVEQNESGVLTSAEALGCFESNPVSQNKTDFSATDEALEYSDSTQVDQNESGVSAPDEALDRFDSTPVEQNESGVLTSAEASGHFDVTQVEQNESGVLTSAERFDCLDFLQHISEPDSSVEFFEADSAGTSCSDSSTKLCEADSSGIPYLEQIDQGQGVSTQLNMAGNKMAKCHYCPKYYSNRKNARRHELSVHVK